MSAIAFRRWDPKPARKVYSWERQADADVEEDDPIIGDQWKIKQDDLKD